MATKNAAGGAGGYWSNLLNRATDVALTGASRLIDAEILEKQGLTQADTARGVDPGQQRVTTTTADQGTAGAGGMFAGSPWAFALLGAGAIAIYLAVK